LAFVKDGTFFATFLYIASFPKFITHKCSEAKQINEDGRNLVFLLNSKSVFFSVRVAGGLVWLSDEGSLVCYGQANLLAYGN
jgi:hypothetical protein